MFGLPGDVLGHLTASGTIANLEALWVARELHPGKAVVYGANAHYTHARMCQVLGIPARSVPADAEGRIDLDAAERECRRGDVGTLVLTAGHHRPGGGGPCGRGARPARAPRRAAARRRRLRRLLHAARGRARPARPRGAVRRDRRVRLGRRRPPQARAAAVRLRRRPVPRPRGRPPLPTRLALHLLHVGRPAPGGDQPRVLTRRRRRRGPVADAPGCCRRRATRASGRSSRRE